MNEIIELRRDLHKHPEVSNEEKGTAQSILKFLEKYTPDRIVKDVGGHGIVALYKGESKGKRIMLRAELDALPIAEINDFTYKSISEGVGHKCGHDGHMAILCAVAKQLHGNRNFKGEVLLLFQPAEEVGLGARAMLLDPKFTEVYPDCIFSLHNLPGYPMGQIVCKTGAFSAAVETLIANISGKTAHAAEPEKGINPALAMSEITSEVLNFQEFAPENDKYLLVTPVHFELGSRAYGTSAGDAHMAFTLRSEDTKRKNNLSKRVENAISRICNEHGLKVKFERREVFSSIMNDEKMVQVIEKAAGDLDFSYHKKNRPFRWGEDFGLFTERFSGAMFGLGAGEGHPALHNPDYDFPDEIIEQGSRMFLSIINQILAE